jgi:GNAT superfamily N-acetyltransferase
MNILKLKLYEFVEIADNANIDFAKYTYNCCARDFVEETVETHWLTEEQITHYKFEDFYLNESNFEIYPFHVLTFLAKSYLMYKEGENNDIFIWVAYTEEKYRGKGYITNLLRELKHQNPEKLITTHTFNESLIRACRNVGVQLLR